MLESKHFNKLSPTDNIFTPDQIKDKNLNKTGVFRKNFKTIYNHNKFGNNDNSSSANILLCLICKKRFTNGSFLVEHLQNNHKINQICTTCGAYFETSSAYNQHLIDEDYHHHSHHRSKQIIISQSGKLRNLKRELNENENEKSISFKKLIKTSLGNQVVEKKKEDEKETEKKLKNPLLALELFVSNNQISSINNDIKKNIDSKNEVKISENPLNLLQKMHSNFNNYVF
jgi:ribosomal protein L31